MADWDRQELELIVADYFDMLASELEGKKYKKADHRRNLQPKLNGRTEASIEFKHQNISAVLRGEGLQWIKGYRPAENFQQALKTVVLEIFAEKNLSIPTSKEEFTSIPDGITGEHILAAINDFNKGVDHRFGPSSTYDVLHDGERYPPKAIVGLAAAYILGKPLQPEGFGGGLETRCFRVLEDNEFTIVRKKDNKQRPLTRAELMKALERYEKDPSGTAETKTRKEQNTFRRYLLGSKMKANCSLCGQLFPADLLITAHIKKRTDCSLDEKTNPDVVMLACKFGCDDLYEKGYIVVDENGIIRQNKFKPITQVMKPVVSELDEKECRIWSDSNKTFFDAHRASHN